MKPEKIDKKIICNENLKTPDRAVLDAAKSEMNERKGRVLPVKNGSKKSETANRRKRIPQLAAVLSCCVAVIVVLCCIPLMLPSDIDTSDAPLVPTSPAKLDKTAISSVSEFSVSQSLDILAFGNPIANSSFVYSSEGKSVFCAESYALGGADVELLVRLDGSGDSPAEDSSYAPEAEFMSHVKNAKSIVINSHTVKYSETDEGIFCVFERAGKVYMLKFGGDMEQWENILRDFIK